MSLLKVSRSSQHQKLAVQAHSSETLLSLKRRLQQLLPHRRIAQLPCLLYGQIRLTDTARLSSLLLRQSQTILVTTEVTERCISLTKIIGINSGQNPPWQPDAQFHAVMRLHGMPTDPAEWSPPQLRLWLHWAAHKFCRPELRQPAWQSLTGRVLAALSAEEFARMCPSDAQSRELWTHLKLLRRLHMAAVPSAATAGFAAAAATAAAAPVSQPASSDEETLAAIVIADAASDAATATDSSSGAAIRRAAALQKMRISRSVKGCAKLSTASPSTPASSSSSSSDASTTGGELWKFLLDLLTDWRYRRVIRWSPTDDGTFCVADPDALAAVWGRRRGNPRMTFATMSRALRHYQRGGMLEKLDRKRKYEYRFLCDMPNLLGYSVGQLRALVDEAHAKESAGNGADAS